MRFFENCYFEYKEDKVAMQMLNLNTKTVEVNISFITSNDFRRLCPENSSKTKQHSQQQQTKSFRQRTSVSQQNFVGALSQGLCADWLVCIAYCISWHLIGSDQLSYLHSLPVCKGKPYLKLSKLILNWTVRNNQRIIALLTISD